MTYTIPRGPEPAVRVRRPYRESARRREERL
jgi:hypothetical protein